MAYGAAEACAAVEGELRSDVRVFLDCQCMEPALVQDWSFMESKRFWDSWLGYFLASGYKACLVQRDYIKTAGRPHIKWR